MRILFCVDTDKKLKKITRRLSKVLNLLNEELYYVDICHIYVKPQADAPHLPATMMEIQQDEERLRMKFLSKCQQRITTLLDKKLKKTAIINSHLIQGNFITKITEIVRLNRYELIVLLPGDKDPLQLLLMGRNVTKIISKVKVPILILPKKEAFRFKKTSFIGMIENPNKDHGLFQKFRVIRSIKEKCIKYLHISVDKGGKYPNIKTIVHKNKIGGFNRFHNKRKRNYIYILNHRRQRGLDRWRKSSFTRSILSKNDASIMVI